MKEFAISVQKLPKFIAVFSENKLCALKIAKCTTNTIDLPPFALKLEKELIKYTEGKLENFSTEIELSVGTKFQQAVWQELLKIPFGETRSYQDIARALGDIKKARAVGGAVNKNPILILVPCHRVTGKNGDLVGFSAGLNLKRKLLNIESVL